MTCAPWHDASAKRAADPQRSAAGPASPRYAGKVQFIPTPTRARRAYLATPKKDKSGRDYIGQDEVLITCGMPAGEAEKHMLDAAEEVGASHEQIRIEPFERAAKQPYSM